ncbi:hypothetical protein FRB96_002737 [Tulasnella sp. 330]|nr:hypothetical protein FRB96_002737 [Tulasnella sp. 330]
MLITDSCTLFSATVRLSSLRCLVEAIPAEKLVLSLYYVLRLPIYQLVDRMDVSDDIKALRHALTNGCQSQSDLSIGLHLLGEGMAQKMLHGTISQMHMPEGDLGVMERSRRNRAERLAWTHLGHNANVDGRLWIKLLVSIGQFGEPELRRIIEKLTERAVLEEAFACEEVRLISSSSPIDDLAIRFIEEAQKLVQKDIHIRAGALDEYGQDFISPPSPSILCAPPSTPIQGVHSVLPITTPSDTGCSRSGRLISSRSSGSSAHTPSDDNHSRRYFVVNPDASLSQISLEPPNSFDGSESPVLEEEVPTLLYNHSPEVMAWDTRSDDLIRAARSHSEVAHEEKVTPSRRTGVKTMLIKLVRKVGRFAVRRAQPTKASDVRDRRMLLI